MAAGPRAVPLPVTKPVAAEFSVDSGKLRSFIEHEVPGFSTCALRVKRHPGGHSCETWSLVANGERWILRRPPRANVQKGASNMAREYRVISALRDTPVPVPRTIALCEDPGVIGSPFFIMEEIDGVVLRHEFPKGFEDSPERRLALGRQLVDTLADIHAVDWQAVGLEKHGRPDSFLKRNLELMQQQWEAVRQRPIEAIETVATYLRSHMPETTSPAIVHGDYKLDNVMWDRGELARLSAVLDWEISTIADPLVDIGWLRGFWCDEGDTRGFMTMGDVLPRSGGFISRDEVVARWAERSGRDVEHVAWYEAFGMWKIAIIMEASYARYLSGNSDDAMFATLDVVVPALAEAGLDALREGGLV